MKALENVLIAVGLVLLLAAVVGKFVGDPGHLLGHRVVSLILIANTTLLLAVVAKLFEKK